MGSEAMNVSHASVHPVKDPPPTEGGNNEPRVRILEIQWMAVTPRGLALRFCLFVSAAVVICVMASTHDFSSVTAFRSRWISWNNFTRMRSNLLMKKLMQRKKLLRSCTSRNVRRVEEKITKFIELQDKEIEDFVGERDKLIKVHEDKIAIMKQRHREEEVEMEKEHDGELTKLMEKYSPRRLEDASNSV